MARNNYSYRKYQKELAKKKKKEEKEQKKLAKKKLKAAAEGDSGQVSAEEPGEVTDEQNL